MEDDLLMSFLSVTGETDPESAQHYLEAANFDLQTAVELFFSNQHQPSSRSSATTTKTTSDEIRSPIPQQASRLYDSFQHQHDYQGFGSSNYNYPSYMQNFNSYNQRGQNQQFQSASRLTNSGDEFSEMFKKPEIVFKGTFEEAKQTAEMEGKWLIVEIQKDDVFDCHRMNRDTWGNELVQAVLSPFFILWQADEGTNQATFFKGRYQVFSYPFVCVIDPRTGENVKTWAGKFIDASTMVDSLQNFVDSHSLLDHLPSPSPSTLHAPNPFEHVQIPTVSSQNRPINTETMDDEDEQLRAAIQASIEEATKMNTSADEDVQIIENPSQTTTSNTTTQQPTSQPIVEPADKKINVSDYLTEQGDTTRIQIRFPDGKREVIKILKNAPLAAIYAVCRQKLQGSSITSFVVTYLDKTQKQKNVDNTLDRTLNDEGLSGVALSVVQE
ncbi:hypothetical protein C9374_011066 [Naegleria lovaniensis]|uniref:UBX domain-containing protein n=1 Tax=Naegleria lovaniensis TaxID=51637 RepID=A0AA88GF40_NAELO|nr:uncharacterized protein C9374_011066 [Naegleria lovaniensis]KAG2374229.1 hypothetical protein C9374_011066 [Naegleria lovaniensis]